MIPEEAQQVIEYENKQIPVDVKNSVIQALSLSKEPKVPERLPTKQDEIDKQIKQILSPMKTKLGKFAIDENTPLSVIQSYSVMDDICKLYTALVSEVMELAIDFKKYEKDYHDKVLRLLDKSYKIINDDEDFVSKLSSMFVVFQEEKFYPESRAKQLLIKILDRVDKLLDDIKYNASLQHIEALIFNDRCIKIEQTDDANMTMYQNMFIKDKLSKLDDMEANKITDVTQNIIENIIKKKYAEIQKIQKQPGTHWAEVTQLPRPDEKIITRFHQQMTSLSKIDASRKEKRESTITKKSEIKPQKAPPPQAPVQN